MKQIMEQRQSVKLAITGRMLQSFHLLQLSGTDVHDYVRAKSESNPFIQQRSREQRMNRSFHAEVSAQHDHLAAAGRSVTQQQDGLEAYIEEQLAWIGCSKEQRRRVLFLTGNLDAAGYLRIDAGEAASALRIGLSEAEEAIAQLQTLDPPGIGGRSLKECLLLQIKRDPKAAPYAAAIVDTYLEELAGKRIEAIRKGLGISPPELEAAAAYIVSLDPKPGLPFSEGEVQHDRFITCDAEFSVLDGAVCVQLNEETEPDFLLRDDLYTSLREGKTEADPQLEAQWQEAVELASSLTQRTQTLKLVMEVIAVTQHAFLEQGWGALVPLTGKQVAERLALHESTVSRAIKGKMVHTPCGMIPLKALMSRHRPAGADIPATVLKERIKAIIRIEDGTSPLTDEQIRTALQAEGVLVSRRAIANYRGELGIPGRSGRRHRIRP